MTDLSQTTKQDGKNPAKQLHISENRQQGYGIPNELCKQTTGQQQQISIRYQHYVYELSNGINISALQESCVKRNQPSDD